MIYLGIIDYFAIGEDITYYIVMQNSDSKENFIKGWLSDRSDTL